MREITIPIRNTVSISIDLESLSGKFPVNGIISIGTMDFSVTSRLLEIARVNVGKVLYSTVSLEGIMGNGITTHLFGPGIPCTSQRNFFSAHFLETSYMEFNAKKSIYVQILKELGVVTGSKEVDEAEKILRNIMNYRNSLAHGKLYTSNDEVYLDYFQGKPRTDTLNDDYWDKLEEKFETAYKYVEDNNELISGKYAKDMQTRSNE